jgi:membrane fusion protein (multidrug efflux system)
MNKKLISRTILIVILGAGIIFGIMKYIELQKYESTDDAQVEGDISPVLPKISGYVTEIRFEDNQHVHKGDTLIRLDVGDLKIKLQQAVAALETARAGLTVAGAGVNTAGSTVEAAKANIEAAKVRVWKANQDLNRYQKLLADKSVTQQQFDAIEAEKESADAMLNAANKQIATYSSQQAGTMDQTKVAAATIKQREADVDLARLQLSYTAIISPTEGTVSRKAVQLGQFVQIGQPLCSIVSSNEVWVVGNFKETQLKKMHEGEKVKVEVDAYKSTEIEGKVASFSGATGAKFSLLPPDNASGNFVKVVQRIPVKIALDKNNSLYKKLKPGMSVNVSVNIE